ncbi:MAG TPA: UDP-N-acetylmuramoyl-L-alanine--D-glutamate ligase [Acidobacteriota bacterium]
MRAAATRIEEACARWSGRRVVVVGAGRSGLAAAHLLLDCGARVTITDARPREQLDGADVLAERGAAVSAGAHPPELWESADVAVFSPGIPPGAPVAEQARDAGVEIVAEIELAAAFIGVPIIAITGSNGKSTVTSMVGAILEAAGQRPAVCGNIGTALSAAVRREVGEGAAFDAYVVEISSFQADAIDRFHPRLAAVLNLQPDHLDWHGSLDRYAAAKLRLARNMTADDWLVFNHDDEGLRRRRPAGPVRLLPFSYRPAEPAPPAAWVGEQTIWWWPADGPRQALAELADLAVIGPHNQANACAAAALAALHGVPAAAIAAGLAGYRPLEHRMEECGAPGGVRCINDSKATNVDATLAALSGFESGVWLILGGRDKGADFSRLRPLLPGRVRRVLLIGEAAEPIAAALGDTCEPQRCGTLERAVSAALGAAAPGDTLLLAPACTSFDQYADFEERGRHFKALVTAATDADPTAPQSMED